MARAARRPTADAGPMLDFDRYVPGLLTWLANKLSRGASSVYRRNFDVGINEWRVMSQLAVEPGISAARICQVVGLDKAVVSRSLAALEKRGLVAGGDQKRRLVELTPAGRSLHDRLIKVALERERRLLACLSPEELETLIDLLNRLHTRLPEVGRPLEINPEN